MTTLYKLVTQDCLTRKGEYNETNWLHSQPSKKIIENPRMCGEDVYHAYGDLNLAFLLNPVHGDIENPRVLECEGDIVVSDFGKVGVFCLNVIREIEKPVWVDSAYELDVRIWFAVLCAESVLYIWEKYSDDKRPVEAILAAKNYLKKKSQINAKAALAAAWNAIYAADASFAAAAAAAAAFAASSAAYAAASFAASSAASFAASSATHAADTNIYIDFSFLAQKAIKLATENI